MMSKQDLGRLPKAELREAWSSEASDFTPWLAQEENLSLLGEAIGIELELDSQEKEVGPFRADILCKDTATGNWVLIENQLERTDHSHLGQLLTYAAGLNAVTVVWIAAHFTEEHRATLDWLNERTDEKINLFGLEVELWRIGDSPIAPKFNIISQPNNWSRTVQQAAAGSGEVSAHKQLQLGYLDGIPAVHGVAGKCCSVPEAIATALDQPRDRPFRRAPDIHRIALELGDWRQGPRDSRGAIHGWTECEAGVRGSADAEGCH
jgi:hypothetical protein